MVIQDGTESPLEMSAAKGSNLESKKYVIVKNHVRELPFEDPTKVRDVATAEITQSSVKTKVQNTKTSKKNKSSELVKNVQISEKRAAGISKEDLEELMTVYRKCKSVLGKIESKYGHLLRLEDTDSNTEVNEQECHCKVNKKIVFDEDGKQTLQEPDLENHVCPKKIKRRHSESKTNINNLIVEMEERDIPLPDDFKSLTKMLQDPDIDLSYRNKVINKVKALRFDIQNEIRFSRPGFIEKLKSDPKNTEIFEFEGANLYTIPGYPNAE